MAFENLKSTGIAYLLGRLKTYLNSTFLKKGEAVTSVNGIGADENGNVAVTSVPLADNLNSSLNQISSDSFLFRTAGGSVSIKSGDASLTKVMGDMAFTTEKTASVQVNGENIVATLDEDDFFSAIESSSASGTVTFTYTSSWDTNPSTYGITVSGTPAENDTIVVTYNKGEITQSDPQTFVSTGWNLYNHDVGYARVKKYSSEPDEVYGIAGAYTALQFSTTLDGEKSTLTVNNGKFDVISDGYVWVTGGNSTTTEIWMTWGDWGAQANGGVFEAYKQAVIDISSIMSDHFEDGLLRAGSYRDEINLTTGKAYSRVEKVAFSSSNLEDVKALGVDYVYDGSYIYYGKDTADEYTISATYTYKADDHGTEFFTGTDVPTYAEILYGQNLKNKLERDVLTKSGDLVDNLTTNDATKALSAKQGKVLKDMISGISGFEVKGREYTSYTSQGQANYDMTSGTRHLIMIMSANANTNGMFMVQCGSTGTITAIEIYKGSNLTLNVATANKFRFILGSGTYTTRLYDFDLTSAV